jgi:uncharacterized protein (DUF736 family)
MKKTIGALWVKEYEKDGQKRKMFSGELDLGVLGTVGIAIFKNEKKDKENQPDYRIVLSEKPKEKSADNNNVKEEDIDF